MSIEIQKEKEKLAEKYIKEFKEELSFFQKMGISLVESKIKELLLAEDAVTDDLGDYELTFFQKVLASISPSTTDKVIEFLKEKQRLLLATQTREQLDALKQGIDPSTIDSSVNQSTDTSDDGGNTDKNDDTDSDDVDTTQNDNTTSGDSQTPNQDNDHQHLFGHGNDNSDMEIIGGGMAAEAVQGGVRRKIGKERAKKLATSIEAKRVKKGLEAVKKRLTGQLHNPKLLKIQKTRIEKSLKIFEDASDANQAIGDISLRKKLSKSGALPETFFHGMKAKEIDALSKAMNIIGDDTTLLGKIAQTSDVSEVTRLLSEKGITNIGDDVIEILAHTNNIEELSSLSYVMSRGTEITKLAKAVRYLPILDLVVFGMDVKHFMKDTKHANAMVNTMRGEIAKNRATMHMAMNVLNLGVGLYAMLASSGPVGWIALGGVAILEGGKIAADSLYYDVQDFYAQDKTDFSLQYTSQIKHAIVSAAVGSTRDNLSLNEEVCEFFGGIDKNKKMKTIDEALRALLYMEHKKDFPLVAEELELLSWKGHIDSLSEEQRKIYNTRRENVDKQKNELAQEKKELQTIIDTRMEYINQFTPGGKKFGEWNNHIKEDGGLYFLDTIIAESNTYMQMKADSDTNADNIADYHQEKEQDLRQKNSKLFNMLETYYNSGREYYEMIAQVRRFQLAIAGTSPASQAYQKEVGDLIPIAEFIIDYHTWKHMGIPPSRYPHPDIIDVDYVDIERMLRGLSQGGDAIELQASTFTQDDVGNYLATSMDTRISDAEYFYTGSMAQNILYRFFHEIHGYQGKNTRDDLQKRASDSDERNDHIGIYYNQAKKQRYINDDNAVDRAINLHDLENKDINSLVKERFTAVPLRAQMVLGSVPLQQVSIRSLNAMTGGYIDDYFRDNKDIIDSKTETTDDLLTSNIIANFVRIAKEEKEIVTAENKEQVENKIIQFVTKIVSEGNYIQLPFHLVNAANRVGLGELQYRFFSVNDKGELIALTNHDMIHPLRLSQVHQYYMTEDKEIHPLEDKSDSIRRVTDSLVHDIETTAGELQLAQRGKVFYDPVEKMFHSRGYKHGLSIEEKQGHVQGLDREYEDITEATRVANFINNIKAYKAEHSDAQFQWGYMGMKDGLYNTSTTPDTQILDPDTIESDYTITFSKEHRDDIVSYLNTMDMT